MSSRYRGLVVGRLVVEVFFAAGFFVVPGLVATACFFAAADFFAAVAAGGAPDDTRDECLARCRVFFGAAASAIDDSVKAAIRAINRAFIVLRAIRPLR
jgi:hypothetical protein